MLKYLCGLVLLQTQKRQLFYELPFSWKLKTYAVTVSALAFTSPTGNTVRPYSPLIT